MTTWVGRFKTYLFGTTVSRELSEEDVDNLVNQYACEGVSDELYKFGAMLLSESESRAAKIDAKATTVVGFGGAILAFLILQAPGWAKATTWELAGISTASLLAAGACVYAFSVLRGARDWEWFSEKQWFNATAALNGPDHLKRHYLKCMHGVKQANHRITNQKADSLIKAQMLLALTAIALGVLLTASAIRTAVVGPSTRPSESGQSPAVGFLVYVAGDQNPAVGCLHPWNSQTDQNPRQIAPSLIHYRNYRNLVAHPRALQIPPIKAAAFGDSEVNLKSLFEQG